MPFGLRLQPRSAVARSRGSVPSGSPGSAPAPPMWSNGTGPIACGGLVGVISLSSFSSTAIAKVRGEQLNRATALGPL